jgi:hypothetical protein
VNRGPGVGADPVASSSAGTEPWKIGTAALGSLDAHGVVLAGER